MKLKTQLKSSNQHITQRFAIILIDLQTLNYTRWKRTSIFTKQINVFSSHFHDWLSHINNNANVLWMGIISAERRNHTHKSINKFRLKRKNAQRYGQTFSSRFMQKFAATRTSGSGGTCIAYSVSYTHAAPAAATLCVLCHPHCVISLASFKGWKSYTRAYCTAS